jgi:hypothetical protein
MAYWIDLPDPRACSSWLALDDTTLDNGCMVSTFSFVLEENWIFQYCFFFWFIGWGVKWFVPGSHLKPLRKHWPAVRVPHHLMWRIFWYYLVWKTDKKKQERVSVCVEIHFRNRKWVNCVVIIIGNRKSSRKGCTHVWVFWSRRLLSTFCIISVESQILLQWEKFWDISLVSVENISILIDCWVGIPVPLKAGSATFHAGGTLHYSRGNKTDKERRG